MILNKKSSILGITFFSALILTSISANQVKVDTTLTSTEPTSTAIKSAVSSTVNQISGSAVSDTTTTPTIKPVSSTSTSTVTAQPDSIEPTSTTSGSPGSAKVAETVGATTTAPVSSSVKPADTVASSTDAAKSSVPETSIAASTALTADTSTTTQVTPTTPAPTVPDDTVVNISDPVLSSEIKTAMGLKATDNITVGAIKNYKGVISADPYNFKKGNVSSLNGLQYFQYLPSGSSLALGFNYSPTSSNDLSYLKSVPLSALDLTANYSQIDMSQLANAKIVTPQNGSPLLFEFFGAGPYQANTTGLTNEQLSQIGPWLVEGMNGKQQTTLEFNQDQLTDFSPLKGLLPTDNVFLVSVGNMHIDSTKTNAVINQPLKFTAEPVIGLDGEDLASGYHFTYNALPIANTNNVANGNLVNLGNDQYEIPQVQQLKNTNALIYGYYGLSRNPGDRTGFVNKKYGNIIFR